MSFGGARTVSVDSVFLWFFSETNFEMGLKILDACIPELAEKCWVFVSGLTDQAWTVRVRDTLTGVSRAYSNPLETLSQTSRDQASFGCF